jgi:tetratricopeptide (TPR) repeat protein
MHTLVTGLAHRRLLIAGVVALQLTTPGALHASPDANRYCECGSTLALADRLAEAESVFVSLLELEPSSPCALNNLGNLRLLAEDAESARMFYTRAMQSDLRNPGILLNLATVEFVLGDDLLAQDFAGRAVDMAGGAAEALRLIGVRMTPGTRDSLRGAELTSGFAGPWTRVGHEGDRSRQSVRSRLALGVIRFASVRSNQDSLRSERDRQLSASLAKSSTVGAPVVALALYWHR